MSISQNPMTGEMRQSMANFVTTVCRGQNIIKAKVFKPRNVNSIAQQLQRASFKLIVEAYDSFGGITDDGFPGRPKTFSPYNAFVKANLGSAIDKSGGVPMIDYSKLIVSEGSLPVVGVVDATIGATGITLTYETDTDTPKELASDQIVAFVKTTKGSLKVARQVRGKQAVTPLLISSPGITAADVVCCYVFAVNAEGTKVSNSVHVEI